MSSFLVIDDSEIELKSLAKLLTLDGHDVLTAPNGRDAWAMLYAGLPDLIVLDLMMPLMDGLTFLRLLRQNPHRNHVPVVILTGHIDKEKMVEQAVAMGVTDVILKGALPPDELVNRLSGWLPAPKPNPRRGNSRLKEFFANEPVKF